MTGIATALRDAIQQTLDGKLSGPALMRQFMTHDEWWVPIHVDDDGKSHAVYIKDTEGQRFQLLYVDEKGYQDGLATIGRTLMGERYLLTNGSTLFSNLSDDADVVAVNWGSTPEIFFKKAQFPSLRHWAQAVKVEKTLATPRPDLSLLKRFNSYYIVLQKVEGGFALTLAPDSHGLKLAAVFTAEDAVDAFLKDPRSGEFNFEPITRSIPGEHLFDDIKDIGLDGIAFNPSGPVPPRRFTAALAGAVMAAD